MLSWGLKSFLFSSPQLSLLQIAKRRDGARLFNLPRAKKPGSGESNKTPSSSFQFSKAFVTKSALVIFALGFVDAGYSGDWSRIGVLSKESEELLKLAAYLVVPFCIFVIFSVSEDSNTSN